MQPSRKQEISNTSFYTQKEDRQIKAVKNWMKAFKMHKHLSPENFQINKLNAESVAYKLTFVNIDELLHSPTEPGIWKIALRCYANFYSKKVKNFFGKTYESSLIYISPKQDGTNLYTFEVPEVLSLYYHQNIDDSAQAFITLELKLLELKSSSILLSEKQLGYAEISIKGLQVDKLISLNLKKGSPREMLSNPDVAARAGRGLGILQIHIDESRSFNTVKHLVPECVLIGSNEILPGILTEDNESIPCLPSGIAEKQITLQQQSNEKIIISPIKITINEKMETDLISKVAQIATGQDQIKAIVSINERKIKIAFHNSWTCINQEGLKNGISLIKNPVGKAIKNDQGKDIQFISLEQKTPVYVDGFYCRDQICVLIFQLEYELHVTTEKKGKTQQTKVLGWLPYPINETEFGSTFLVEDQLISGSGKTVDGVRMIDLGNDYQISIMAQVDATKTSNNYKQPIDKFKFNIPDKLKLKQQKDEDENEDFIPPKQIDTETKQKTKDDSQSFKIKDPTLNYDDIYAKKFLEEQKKTQQLEEQLKKFEQVLFSQKPGTQGGNMSAEQFNQLQKTLYEFQQREQVLLQQMEMLKTQSIIEQKNSQKDLQEIKSLLQEVQERPKTQQDFFKNSRQNINQQSINQPFSRTFQGPYVTKDKDPSTGDVVLRTEGDFERMKFLENLTQVPKVQSEIEDKAFVVQPQFGPQNLSRKDVVYLHNSGIKGILDDINADNNDMLEENELIKEVQDQYKANKISVQFLALKPMLKYFSTSISNKNSQKDTFFSENFFIPDRLYFSMNFFDFPLFKTDTITYLNQQHPSSIKQSLIEGNPLVFVKEAFLQKITDQKEPKYLFDIDPSKSKFETSHEEFINYLYYKSMHIDIWDADSLMLYGTVKIPLRNLLRQGKREITLMKEVEIIEPNFNRIKGSLQIQMKNYEFPCEIVNLVKKDNKTLNTLESSQKKKVNSKPMNIPKILQKQNPANLNSDLAQNQDERKKERIRRFKMQQMHTSLDNQGQTDKVIGDLDSKLEVKKKLIQEISQYKETQKEQLVKNILSEFLNIEKLLSVSLGKSQIFCYEFINAEKYTQIWTIQIQDPDTNFFTTPELTLVQNPNQWQFFVEKYGFKKPENYELINNNTFSLEPGLEVSILFKFQTFREFDPNLQNFDNIQEIIESKDESYRKEKIYQRTINVYFRQKDIDTINGFKLKIQPHADIVDHLFRYYERENRDIKLELPSLYHFSTPNKENRPRLVVTKKAALAEWMNEREVCIKLKVPSAGVKKRFNLLAYSDDYLSDLLGNWLIELNALSGMDLSVAMGKKVSGNLTIFADISRYTVKLYSSHPLLLWFPSPYDSPFQLTGGKHTPIKMNIKSFTQQTQAVQINCVDITTRELIHSWIVRIDTEVPTLSPWSFEINVDINNEVQKNFPFQNAGTELNIFNFESQNPEILQLVEQRIKIDAGKTVYVQIRIKAQEQKGSYQVFVFASDQDETNVSCLLFKINYV